MQSRVYFIEQVESVKATQNLGYILFVFTLLYMGTRPISWAFGDMGTMQKDFKNTVRSQFASKNGCFFWVFYSVLCRVNGCKYLFLFGRCYIYYSVLFSLPKNIFLSIGLFLF
jgi:hypothetical protein